MRDSLRRVPLLVWLLTALHVALMVAFAFLYPPYTQFDEAQHVDGVVAVAYNHTWPAPGKRVLSQAIVLTADADIKGEDHKPFSDDPTTPRSQRRSFASLDAQKPADNPDLLNQMVQHPPGFYGLAAGALKLVPGSNGWAYDKTVLFLRLLCALLVAPVPLLAYAFVRVVGGAARVGTTAAALPLLAPQLERVGASVNNDSLLILATSVCTVLLARVMRDDLRWRTAVWLGVALGIALFTKGFALVLIPCVAVAYLVKRRWLLGLGSLAVAFVLGGWWWLHNLVVYGRIQPDGIPGLRARILGPATPDKPLSLGDFLWGTYLRLSVRFWGSLGINYAAPETFPKVLTHVLAALSLVLLVAAFVRWRPLRGTLAVSALLPFLGTLAIVVAGIWGTYSYSRAFGGAQGRYLFGVMAALSAVAALGLHALLARRAVLHRVAPVAVVALALLLQADAVRYVLRVNWLPGPSAPHRLQTALDGIRAFSPVTGGVAVGSLWTVVVVAAAVVAAAALSLRSAEGDLEVVEEGLVRDRDVAGDHVALDDLQHDDLGPLDGAGEAVGADGRGLGVQDPGAVEEGGQQVP